MHAIKRIGDVVTVAAAWLAGLAVVVMMCHVTADVASRLLMGKPLPGTIVLVANYYMVLIVCLPLAFVERLDQHIAVDVVTDRLSVRLRLRLRAAAWLFSAAVFALLTYAAWLEAVDKFARKAFVIEHDLALPIWYSYFALPLGCGLLSLYLLGKFVGYIAGPAVNDRDPARLSEQENSAHD